MDNTPKPDSNAKPSLDVIQENQKRVAAILKLATLDAAFRKKLLENPKEIVDEVGVVYPPGTNIIVVEVPANTIPLVVPPFVGRD